MRCFIAVDMPEEVKQELGKIQEILPEAKSKLVELENLHLTLVFLGELTDYQINQVKEALEKIKFGRFKTKTGNLGVFPSESFIRVVWVSLEPAQTLKALHDNIFEELKKSKLGNVKLDSRFESHVTLARIKFISDKKKFLKKLQEIKPKKWEFQVESFALKKSTLTRKGPLYEDIIKFNLS